MRGDACRLCHTTGLGNPQMEAAIHNAARIARAILLANQLARRRGQDDIDRCGLRCGRVEEAAKLFTALRGLEARLLPPAHVDDLGWRHSAERRTRIAYDRMKKAPHGAPFRCGLTSSVGTDFELRGARHSPGLHRRGGLLRSLLLRYFWRPSLPPSSSAWPSSPPSSSARPSGVRGLLLGRSLLDGLLCRPLLRCGLLRRASLRRTPGRVVSRCWYLRCSPANSSSPCWWSRGQRAAVHAAGSARRPPSQSPVPADQFHRAGDRIGAASTRQDRTSSGERYASDVSGVPVVPTRHVRTHPDKRRDIPRHHATCRRFRQASHDEVRDRGI